MVQDSTIVEEKDVKGTRHKIRRGCPEPIKAEAICGFGRPFKER
jgi:hypothetical protein